LGEYSTPPNVCATALCAVQVVRKERRRVFRVIFVYFTYNSLWSVYRRSEAVKKRSWSICRRV
jgi:hypothetical protein